MKRLSFLISIGVGAILWGAASTFAVEPLNFGTQREPGKATKPGMEFSTQTEKNRPSVSEGSQRSGQIQNPTPLHFSNDETNSFFDI